MIVIGLGANIAGRRGNPVQTLNWALQRLSDHGLEIVSRSSLYISKALLDKASGHKAQPDYVNMIVTAHCAQAALTLLGNLKLVEELAGRKTGEPRILGRWRERPLDLDIIDYKGLVSKNYNQPADSCGWPHKLVLPHPQAHLRPFVIAPLAEIMPFWHHPVLKLAALDLLARLRLARDVKTMPVAIGNI